MTPKKRKVLVCGDDTQAFLATVRSLGRQGADVHVIPFDFQSSALRSRYIKKIHRVPTHIGDGSLWLAAITELLTKEKFDLVMPCTDNSLLPLHVHREKLELICPLALPAAGVVDILFDKVHTRELAQRLGIAVSKGITFEPGDPIEIAVDRIGLPFVLKPRRSFHLGNLLRRETVDFVYTREQARELLSSVRTHGVLLESFFEGFGLGVSALIAGGEVLQFFQHRRIHPADDGNSGYRCSEDLDPRLAQACGRLAAELQYTGMIMFEFRMNPQSRDWILLEANARPWGSLPLPVSLGIDFPAWWMDLILSGRRHKAQAYPSRHYARNLTKDAVYLAGQIAKHRKTKSNRAKIVATWLFELTRLLIGRESIDSLVIDDVRPGLDELRKLWRRAYRKLFGRRPTDVRARLQEELARIATQPDSKIHVEFVCHGNMCRSPYAERLLRRVLPESLAACVTVGSSGFYAVEGRSSPTDAIESARRCTGVDLTTHRSRILTSEIAESSTVIAIFDERNEESMLSQFPQARARTYWLGDFLVDGQRGARIADPYAKDAAEFDRCYGMIEDAVKAMVYILSCGESVDVTAKLARSL